MPGNCGTESALAIRWLILALKCAATVDPMKSRPGCVSFSGRTGVVTNRGVAIRTSRPDTVLAHTTCAGVFPTLTVGTFWPDPVVVHTTGANVPPLGTSTPAWAGAVPAATAPPMSATEAAGAAARRRSHGRPDCPGSDTRTPECEQGLRAQTRLSMPR